MGWFLSSLFFSLSRLRLSSSDYKFTHIPPVKLTLQSERMLTIWLSNYTWLEMQWGTKQKLIERSVSRKPELYLFCRPFLMLRDHSSMLLNITKYIHEAVFSYRASRQQNAAFLVGVWFRDEWSPQTWLVSLSHSNNAIVRARLSPCRRGYPISVSYHVAIWGFMMHPTRRAVKRLRQ